MSPALLGLLALTLGDASVHPGQIVHSVSRAELSLELQVQGAGGQRTERIERSHAQELTLQPEPTGFVVRWVSDHYRALQPGWAVDGEQPVAGRAYRVTDTIDALDSAPVSEEERAIVGQLDLLTLLRELRAMLGDELTPDTPVPAGPMFAGLLAEAPGEGRVESGTLTWVDTVSCGPAQCVVLALELELSAEGTDDWGATVRTAATSTGTVWVEQDSGRARRLTLSGPVSVTARGPGLRSEGSGHFEVHHELDYR